MDYGLVLPSLGDDSNLAGIETAIDLAARHGFTDVWTTDHILVGHDAAEDYGRLYEAVTTLAWAAARNATLRLGASVIVVPMRESVLLAKQLATVDALSRGRLIAGFGVGWNRHEFESVGAGSRFIVRGAYLEETINLCRHLWSGNTAPFHGRFVDFDDFVFGPLPHQGADLPIWVGARDERALDRVGRLANAYHASATSPASYAPRIPIIRAAAQAASRPMPRLSARVRIELGAGPQPFYTLHGSAEQVAAGIQEYAALGVDHLALAFTPRDGGALAEAMGRFDTDVRPLV